MFRFLLIFLLFFAACDSDEQFSASSINTKTSCGSKSHTCCYEERECISQCDQLFPKYSQKNTCINLPNSRVSKMYYTIENILEDPDRRALKQVDTSILLKVLNISEKPWLNKINNYSTSEAQSVLNWLASDQNRTTDFFDNLRDSQVRKLLVSLLRRHAPSSETLVDDNRLLAGMKTSFTEDQGENFLFHAREYNNRELMKTVHELIIKEHICEYSLNHPQLSHPQISHPQLSHPQLSHLQLSHLQLRYPQVNHPQISHPQISHPQLSHSNYFSDENKKTCMLAVYCHLTGNYSEVGYESLETGERLRKQFAREVGSYSMEKFIAKPLEEGGLGVQDDNSRWTNEVCSQIGILWDDNYLKINL